MTDHLQQPDKLDASTPADAQAPDEAHALDALGEHLREIGAESHTERTVKVIVPWFTSLLLHGGLIVLGFAVVFGLRLAQPEEDPVLVSADWNQLNYQAMALVNPNQANENQQTVQDRMRTESVSQTLSDQLRELDLDPISLLSDAGSRSDLADFAPQPKQGTAKFAGLTGTNARRIVFIVDASGSMIGTLQIVIEELSRSIDQLSGEQEFAVIFFQRNEALVVPPKDRLIPAVPDEKLRALKWMQDNVIPRGRSNPIEAVRAGLKLDPDVVFLLSNNITGSGQFEIDQADLLELLDELNPIDDETGRRTTLIKCIQFLDPDPLDTLRRIAEEHGGERGYKFLDRQELGMGDG